MPVQRAKHSRKKCKDCKYWKEGWCDIFYSRHDAMTPRCKDDYEPISPLYTQGRFWFLLLIGIVMGVGVVVKLTGG